MPTILEFQPTLARAIFHLDELYASLASERKLRAQRKKALNRNWFIKRMRAIREYQDALEAASSIGRCLGDAFAWTLYSHDPDSFAEHSKHEPIRHIPHGVGGRGEVAFIRAMQIVDGYFILYHGITTSLRHGDVSFVNLGTRKLAAIGDIKTKQVGPKELEIDIGVIGSADLRLRDILFAPPASDAVNHSARSDSMNLPATIQAKLDQQLRAATSVLAPTPADKNLSLAMDSALPQLSDLLDGRHKQHVFALKSSDSQIIVRVRQKGRRLSNRLMTKRTHQASISRSNVAELTKAIRAPSKEDNHLHITSILNPTAHATTMPGMIPLLWWHLPRITLERLLFHHDAVLSIFNTGPFVHKLRSLGLTVNVEGRRLKAYKPVGSSKLEIRGLDYFVRLVVHQSFHEDAVIELIRRILATAEAEGLNQRTEIDLRIQQIYSSRPA